MTNPTTDTDREPRHRWLIGAIAVAVLTALALLAGAAVKHMPSAEAVPGAVAEYRAGAFHRCDDRADKDRRDGDFYDQFYDQGAEDCDSDGWGDEEWVDGDWVADYRDPDGSADGDCGSDGWSADDWGDDAWDAEDWDADDWDAEDWDADDWGDGGWGAQDCDAEAWGADDWDAQDYDADDWGDGDWSDFETPIVTAAVSGDRIDTEGQPAEAAAEAEAIWNRFAELIPAGQRAMVTDFELLDARYDGAHVYPDDVDPTVWTLGVGMGLGSDLDFVLIHEFAHLLTLNAGQVPPSGGGRCATYHTGEGCALSDSTIAEFVDRFWPEDLRRQAERDPDAAYRQNPDHFVTDYAATNPGEDLAEVFTHFVLDPQPSGDTIADQKIQMLWDDPAMVELRTQIRANL